MRTILLTSFLFVGCATEDARPADGLDVTSYPDRLSGTYTRDGISVAFDFSRSTVVVKTIDRVPVVEATLDTGIHIDQDFAHLPEGRLVVDLLEVLGDDAVVACPPAPRWWQAIVAAATDQRER